jgi:signal recognition particle receptor subunit beta
MQKAPLNFTQGENVENPIINETYRKFRTELTDILGDMQGLIEEINNPELLVLVGDLVKMADEPFLFVTIGEIKAGKSSFINALLRSNICAVDPAPCTDIIQKIVYAPEKNITTVSENIRRIALPAEILKQIAIVDTPGTNTVVDHHQEITEGFIPSSDLVFFIFAAKNPHTRSAWKFLDFVNRQWRKRVVFILQQADLADENELAVNTAKVREYALAHGIEDPVIFQASARLEFAGDKESGFPEIRAFIHETVTGGRHFYLKLRSVMDTGEQVLKRVYDALQQLRKQLDADMQVATKIEQRLVEGQAATTADIRTAVDRLLQQYDELTDDLREEFEEGLSMPVLLRRAFSSVFSGKKSIKVWLAQLQEKFSQRLTRAFEELSSECAKGFLVSLDKLLEDTRRALEQIEDTNSLEAAGVVDLGGQREDVIFDIKKNVGELAATDFFSSIMASNPQNMPSMLMGGGALTVIGAILLTASHASFLDITGGVLTGTGLLIAGGVLVVKKGKIIKEFLKGIAAGRQSFEQELEKRLTEKFDRVHADISKSVGPFFDYLRVRERELGPLVDRGRTIHNRLLDLSSRFKGQCEK